MSEHLSEDRLLELAYGELSPQEAAAAEAHAQECPQCARPLREIRSVRRVMAELPAMHPPASAEASLLAYAEQTAGRRKARRGSGWKQWLAPLTTVLAFSLVVVVGVHAVRDTAPSEVLVHRSENPEMRAPVEFALPPPTSSALGSSSEGFAKPPPSSPVAEKGKVARRAAVTESVAVEADRELQDESSARSAQAFKKRERYAEPPSSKPEDMLSTGRSKGSAGAVSGEDAPSAWTQEPRPRPRGGMAAPVVPEDNKQLRAPPAEVTRNDFSVAPPASPAFGAPAHNGTAVEQEEKDSRTAAPEGQRTDRLAQLDAAPQPAASSPPPAKALAEDLRPGLADKRRGAPVRDEALARKQAKSVLSLDEIPGVLATTGGAAREPLLHRLCDEEHRPEHEAEARVACRSLIDEFPRSRWVPAARARLQSTP